ncbi:TIGR03009 domain-containing protein [Roseiconus lacunae]|uniref:TIGR03009 domain-containing protein n=2 Tax=Roseiconus lacunae TaxID=2605694 RepID=A0ABT7PCY2_9BACT|nr:TIGR03009 domain-containing protein [Roseiconus lacunae]MCD0459661.1 TIGR03009 domain-containing protein [Roseiconus lacunae]MDM4014360.1 TIGR03009 domain-containing protein [Roseiconus lacunae]WRQ49674.1 TIGR03009 domain-containing protein [Stieleria sp. HD01]
MKMRTTRCQLLLLGVLSGLLIAVPKLDAQQPAAAAAKPAAPVQPFPPLNAQQQQQLDRVLLAWQQKSQSTKTLECKFERWHYDLLAAPAGVHAHKAEGVVKYANPDKGLFRVDNIMFYKGMKDQKPEYGPTANKFGEYWICNGTQLIEYDREQQQCNLQELPPNMQGTQIFNSPLPFVFNLDAKQIQQRYWVCLGESPKPNSFLVQAFPKLQEDRAQYKMVQVVLSADYEPEVMIMYAPNFHQKLAPQWDHYEFTDVKRNAIGAGIQQFMGNFIPKQPPASWKITKQNFLPPQIAQGNQAPQGSAPQ